ncbi:uncharacterized protein LOC142634700 [Castanea sativa]|uniref:uncharacterized protein LOC142634700 n=1 Tax=Castanea sativa TaxID=21020 RepID=UPI003F64AF14
MSLFQTISMLISFIIIALATKQNLVNGISTNSYSDICYRTPQPNDCNKCFFFNPGSATADLIGLAKILIDACASTQAQNLKQMFDNLNATDPNQSTRATYGYCASMYQDIHQKLANASSDLGSKNYQEARSDVQAALVFHFQCFKLLRNMTYPDDLGTYLRSFWAYALDSQAIIDKILK